MDVAMPPRNLSPLFLRSPRPSLALGALVAVVSVASEAGAG
jgi:hypothetical protein